MRILTLSFGLVASGIFAAFSAHAADRVAASDRVETHVRVRAAPSTASAIIGALAPGETLLLRTSVPNWHEVVLPNGLSGFVSKSWTRVIPDSPVVSATTELRLGAWNIRKLGHGDAKDYSLLVAAIESHFDILAVVEVMQKAGGHPGYDRLMQELGPQWSGMVTTIPLPNTSSGSAEFYAIIFRPSRVRTCDQWPSLRIHEDHDGSESGLGEDVFSREPAFGCFVAVRSDGSAGFDFLLAAYHARWAEGDVSDIQGEVSRIPAVFSSMAALRPGERDLLIAGDFNLRPTDLALAMPHFDATAGTGSTLNSAGDVTMNLYDHLVIFDQAATSELVQPATVLDLRSHAASNQVFFRTVSDHLPIVARFRIDVDDD